MKQHIITLLILFISTILTFAQENKKKISDFPVLRGPYLGQKPPGLTPEIFALGIISTDKGELNAMFSPDGNEFYFTKEVVPGRSYVTYYMQQEKNIWSEPILAPILKNYKGGEPSISPDGKYLFFRSMLDKNGNRQDNADIWWIKRTNNNSNKAKKIGLSVNSEFNEAYPNMSSDSVLYFHSNRKGSEGGVDLYYSKYVNGNFTNPVNFGSNVNSQFPEFHPCISPDGNYLIFSSLNRPDGFGNIDLYVTFRDKNGKWTKAINLGDNINSEAGDYMPFISYDGKYLFYTSTRNKKDNLKNNPKNGRPDIYWVDAKIIKELKP